LGWLSRDGKLLLLARPLQSFGTSFVNVTIAIFFTIMGLPLWQVGVVLSGGLLVSTFFNLITGFLADRFGRRRSLVIFGLLNTLSGLVFAFVSDVAILVAFSVLSALGYRGEFGPYQMLERVILAQCCPAEKRTRAFAFRSTLDQIAAAGGSISAGMIVFLQQWFAFTQIESYRFLFGLFAFLNVVVTVLYSQLSGGAEVKLASNTRTAPLSPETSRNVLRISLLFSLDAFGGGFITNSLTAYWFFARFGLNLDVIGVIFSASAILSAASFILAARISERIGLINTMVYSHIPSNLMTMAIPYMPTLPMSTTVYLSRALLSQMDVPTRQSYTMAIVKPEERSRAEGMINLPRSLTLAVSPGIAGAVMEFVGMSFPFLIAGGLKSAYDLMLYFTFRKVKPMEER